MSSLASLIYVILKKLLDSNSSTQQTIIHLVIDFFLQSLIFIINFQKEKCLLMIPTNLTLDFQTGLWEFKILIPIFNVPITHQFEFGFNFDMIV